MIVVVGGGGGGVGRLVRSGGRDSGLGGGWGGSRAGFSHEEGLIMYSQDGWLPLRPDRMV